MKIILASNSPRRKELMRFIGHDFLVHVPKFDEKEHEKRLKEDGFLEPVKISLELAKLKAEYAYRELKDTHKEELLIISADTIVVLDGQIFPKGENREKSLLMLKNLNAKKHSVYTGVNILFREKNTSFFVKSDVYFANNKEELLEYYIDKYLPFDKAGAYGIQDAGSLLVEKIEGSYTNIVGLPIREVYNELEKIINSKGN